MKLSLILFLLLFISAVPASGATIHVPGNFPSIQEGIDAAVNGDTVLVAPGTYVENILFSGKAITVKSSGGAVSTVIDGGNPVDPDFGSAAIFSHGELRDSVLDGFTLTNGSGVDVAGTTRGGGIYLEHASPRIVHNIITENTAMEGAGIFSGLLSMANIKNNIISHHDSPGAGAGIHCYNSFPEISGNFIHNNTSASWGGGIFCTHHASSVISNNLIWKNHAEEGGGIFLQNQSWSDLYNNTIVENSASMHGGGIGDANFAFYIHTRIWDCILWGNAAPTGPSMAIDDGSIVSISHSDVEGGQGSVAVISGILEWNAGMIDQAPLFLDATNGDFHLSQDPCQPGVTNPCVDTGSRGALFMNLQNAATRSDGIPDSGQVDMGYHYGPYSPRQLFTDVEEISAATGGSVSLYIKDLDDAGRNYLILGSYTGVSPGTPLPGGLVILPLTWDLFTGLVATYANTSTFFGFMGTLGVPNGNASSKFTMPPVPGAVGISLYFAFMLNNPFDMVSNPVKIEIVP